MGGNESGNVSVHASRRAAIRGLVAASEVRLTEDALQEHESG